MVAEIEPEPPTCRYLCIPAVKMKEASSSNPPSMITDDPQWVITGAHSCEITIHATWLVPEPPGIVASGVNVACTYVPFKLYAVPE